MIGARCKARKGFSQGVLIERTCEYLLRPQREFILILLIRLVAIVGRELLLPIPNRIVKAPFADDTLWKKQGKVGAASLFILSR